jgi:hypothetical protein
LYIASSGKTFLDSALTPKVARALVETVAESAESMAIDAKTLAPSPLYASKRDNTLPAKPDRAAFFPEFNPTLI